MNKIPLVDLQKQYASINKEIDQAITEVIATSNFIRGPELGRFEDAFSQLHGIKHAIGVGSGTDALHLASLACGIEPGDEVITVANSWISSAFTASYVGARPVFVDIDADTYQIDADGLEQAITPNTKAVVAVHLYGHPAPMDRIMEICRPRGIRVIEDVAQAPLAELDGKITGTFGDVACYSFYPSKNLGCYGDGGAILTNDDELAEKIRILADYGQQSTQIHSQEGYNSRLDTIQAAVLNVKLQYLEKWTAIRRERAALYNTLLQPLPVKTPTPALNAKPVYHLYVIQTENRDACLGYLRDHGVMSQLHYRTPLHLQPCFKDFGYNEGDFPIAEAAAETIISLPICAEISIDSIEQVVATLGDFLEPTSHVKPSKAV